MSGRPTGSCFLVMAAVVINPPRVPDAPETRFAVWLRMGALRNLSESNRGQKPAMPSKFLCVIIEIGVVSGFRKAALRITPNFLPELGVDGTFPPGRAL